MEYQLKNESFSMEANLVEEAKSNPEAFRPLYEKYFKRIFIFILHKVEDKDVSADLCSQVFLKAMTNLQTYQHKDLPFSAWLYRIAVNETMGHFRKTQKTRYVVIDEKMLERLYEEVEKTDMDSFKVGLARVMEMLSLNEVQLIELRFFEEKSFKEIGFILNITENNAKVKLYRLLDKIRIEITKKR
jgi:RNA polymerase sigma-70 factor, ECF subfamily